MQHGIHFSLYNVLNYFFFFEPEGDPIYLFKTKALILAFPFLIGICNANHFPCLNRWNLSVEKLSALSLLPLLGSRI